MSETPRHNLLKFLAVWLEDREAGRERTLTAYQALFPRDAAGIAEEWERAHQARATRGGATHPGSTRTPSSVSSGELLDSEVQPPAPTPNPPRSASRPR